MTVCDHAAPKPFLEGSVDHSVEQSNVWRIKFVHCVVPNLICSKSCLFPFRCLMLLIQEISVQVDMHGLHLECNAGVCSRPVGWQVGGQQILCDPV